MVLTLFKEGGKVLCITLYKTLMDVFRPNYMNKEDAYKILGVTSTANSDLITKRYLDLFNRNSRMNNGSKYLQSKIKNAYEFLSKDFEK